MAAKRHEHRYYINGPIKRMAEADGYVMVRRPGCTPFILSRKEWDALEPVTLEKL